MLYLFIITQAHQFHCSFGLVVDVHSPRTVEQVHKLGGVHSHIGISVLLASLGLAQPDGADGGMCKHNCEQRETDIREDQAGEAVFGIPVGNKS